MFQYACARMVQEIYHEPIRLNMLTYMKKGHRSFSLNHYRLNEDVRCLSKFESFLLGGYYRVKMRLYKQYCQKKGMSRSESTKYLKSHNLLGDDGIYGYIGADGMKKGNKYLNGFFQNPRYFSEIRQILRDEFTCIHELSSKNRVLYEKIKSENSVCLHIRLGDYKSEEWAPYLDLCTEQYYNTAMDMLCERIKDPVFYVFTNTHNDMEWIRQNYRFDHPVQYVDNENTDYEDLRLMCGCRHFILSNSTFSWWSQYIAEYSDGIVIAPSKWFRSDGKKFIHEDERAIYLDNWILVDIP